MLIGLRKEGAANKMVNEIDLSPREIEILKELLKGKTNKEAGKSLSIAACTVDFHRRRIYSKTNTDNMPDLTMYAIKNRIISLPG